MNYENYKGEEKKYQKPEIVLSTSIYGNGFPEGTSGEIRKGFSFFEVYIKKFKNGGEKEIWEFITSQFGDSPMLSAVNNEQYNEWKKKDIRAIPVEFEWNGKEKIWKIKN